MSDLWAEASVDVEADAAQLALTRAKVACASLWPFLAMAKTAREFEHRLALADDSIVQRVPVVMYDQVVASLREDFRSIAVNESDGGDYTPNPMETAGQGGGPSAVSTTNVPQGAGTGAGAGAASAIGGGFDQSPNPNRVTASYFDQGLGRWVKLALDDDANSGAGNPWYFTGGEEAGPQTGRTEQFPTFPVGNSGDPWNPMNSQYPMQPSAWATPPGGEWKEEPMNFSPPEGAGAHHGSRGRRPFAEPPPVPGMQGTTAARVSQGSLSFVADRQRSQPGDTDTCRECGLPTKFVTSKSATGPYWSHTGEHGAAADDDHLPHPKRYKASRSPAARTAGGNPEYFAGGTEGVSGDQQSGFPQDATDPEDEEDRANTYGAVPPQQSHGTTGRRRTATEEHRAPASEPNLGTDFASPEEAERYRKGWSGEEPGNRDSTAMTGSRHSFFDPTDPDVRMVRTADAAPVGESPETPPAMTPGGPGAVAGDEMQPGATSTPQTTKPRQIPGGGGGGGGGGDNPFAASRHLGENRTRPTTSNPFGTADPFDATTWDNATHQRPTVGLEHMKFNGPQNPMAREPIRTVHSPVPGLKQDEEDEDDD